MGTYADEHPPDPELSEGEQKRYREIVNFPEDWATGFVYEQSCLMRNRLKSLNSSSKRIEIATYILLIVTIILLATTLLGIWKNTLNPM